MDELFFYKVIENLLFDDDFDFHTCTIKSTGEVVDYDEYEEDNLLEVDSIDILDLTDLNNNQFFFYKTLY